MKRLASTLSLLALAFVSACNKQEPKSAAPPPAKAEPAKPAAPPAPRTLPKLDGPSAVEIIQKVNGAYAAITNYTDTGKTVTAMDMSSMDFSKLGMSRNITDSDGFKQTMAMSSKQTVQQDFTLKLARPGRYVIEWEMKSPAMPGVSMGKGAVWSDGTSHYLMMSTDGYSKMPDQMMALAAATGISGGAANTVPNLFFQGPAAAFEIIEGTVRLPDEKLGEDDCYILERSVGGMMQQRYWVRKADHLVCQQQQIFGGSPVSADKSPALTDEDLRQTLKATKQEATPENMDRMRKMMEGAKAMTANIKGTITETHTAIRVNQPLKSADLTFNPPSTAQLVPSPLEQHMKKPGR
ncbi:MAG: hypothetical protein ABMA26_02035 [Limisphaerales bacterium]